ncbi:hypothetical protein BSKO_00700 [Bryopsis sp. KO-2023]|nr:hypothetical protein BSKO_00700 [Bryopsis sp. KO-2023]
MCGYNRFALVLGILVVGICHELAVAQKETSGGGPSPCPSGEICAKKLCKDGSNGAKTCCKCTAWNSNGNCLKDAWSKIDGPGTCDFAVQSTKDLKACPQGVNCELSKCTGEGDGQTCCECNGWQGNGKCDQSAWTRTKGEGKCDVVPGDRAKYVTGRTIAGEVKNKGKEPAEIVQKKDEKKLDVKSKLDGINGTDPSPEQPILQAPEFDSPACKEGAECGDVKCSPGKENNSTTCCGCSVWDGQGKCLPGSWTVKSGSGNCDFLVSSEPELPVSVPRNSTADPKQLIDPLPFAPCPPGVTCETTKCATTDGMETCCDCVVWRPDGRCSNSGWRARDGTSDGGCQFAFFEKGSL